MRNVLTRTEELTDAMGAESPISRSVFNHLAPWIASLDAVQHKSTEQMSQLAVNYQGSPLAESHGHSGSLRGGDRMPDVPVMMNGETTPLFRLLDPSAFTLLYSNIGEALKTQSEIQGGMAPWQHLMRDYQIGPAEQHSERFTHLFGERPAISLVRPDGYIAFTGTDESAPELFKFCEKWLFPKRSWAEVIEKVFAVHDSLFRRLAEHDKAQ